MLQRLKEVQSYIFVGIVLIIAYKVSDNYIYFFDGARKLLSLMRPFFWGFAIAYFLNSTLKYIESHHKIASGWALLITYFVFFLVLGIFISLVAPVIVTNIMDIINKFPGFTEQAQTLFNRLMQEQRLVELLDLENYFDKNFGTLSAKGIEILNYTLNSLVQSIISLTSGILQFVVGIIVSAYILLEKERFATTICRMLHALYGKERAEGIVQFFKMCDEVFRSFFVGKAIDSAIIGVICFAGMSLMRVPYAMLLSVIVGIFNMIPYVGPFIGAVPAIVITLLSSPIQALWVSIFIIVLQQVDGNIIGPKILGQKVGISPFFILLSITIGGGFFGMLGMLVAVPIFKVLSVVWGTYVDRRIALLDDRK